MSIENLLSRLSKVSKNGAGRYRAICPAHESKSRSQTLALREAEDGRVLIHCHAGCSPSSIMDAVGLQLTDLFPEPLTRHAQPEKKRMTHAIRQAITQVGGDMTYIAICADAMAKGQVVDVDKMCAAAGRVRLALEACE